MSVHRFWPSSWLMGTLQMGKIIAHLFLDYMATFSEIQHSTKSKIVSLNLHLIRSKFPNWDLITSHINIQN